MTRTISFGRMSRLRMDDNPDHPCLCDGRARSFGKDALAGQQRGKVTEKVRILEVAIPRGARTLYGLIGCKFSSAASTNELAVDVVEETSASKSYDDALVSPLETIKIDLPAAYAAAAVSGIERAINSGAKVKSGELYVCYAAYGDVSSSEYVFERLGFCLANVVALELEEITPELFETLWG